MERINHTEIFVSVQGYKKKQKFLKIIIFQMVPNVFSHLAEVKLPFSACRNTKCTNNSLESTIIRK